MGRRPADVSQFAGRIHGVGRGAGGAAHVRYLVAAGTVDEDLCEVLQRKAGWARRAVDGEAEAPESEWDIHDQVLARMKERQ